MGKFFQYLILAWVATAVYLPAAIAEICPIIGCESVSGGGLADAPSDGTEYLRKDGDWVNPTSTGGTTEVADQVTITGTGTIADPFVAVGGGVETDPEFASWLSSFDPFETGDETDPIFSLWLSSFDPFETSDETDPVFGAWIIATPPLYSEVDGSTTNEIEVADEVFNATNFNGGTTSAVSQDDFYDRFHLFDADDDGVFTDETWYPAGSVDWTTDQDPADIHEDNIPDLTGRAITFGDEDSIVEGVAGWDATLDQLEIGDGATKKVFQPAGEDPAYEPAITEGGIGATDIASTAVTPGSYTNSNITVDADGRITSAANGSAGTGSGMTYASVDESFTIEPNYRYSVKPVGVIIATTDATPTAGDMVEFDVPYDFGVGQSFTVDCNGSNVEGIADDEIVVDEPGAYFRMYYQDATIGWRIINKGVNDFNLEEAVAPAACSGNIGNELTTDADSVTGTNRIVVQQITANCTGSLASIHVRAAYTNESRDGTYVIYSDNGSNVPDALLWSSAFTADDISAAHWITVSCDESLTDATKYWIGFITEDTTTNQFYSAGTGGVSYRGYVSDYSSPPAAWSSVSSSTSQTYDMESYVSY